MWPPDLHPVWLNTDRASGPVIGADTDRFQVNTHRSRRKDCDNRKRMSVKSYGWSTQLGWLPANDWYECKDDLV